jgi:hypothetical protein
MSEVVEFGDLEWRDEIEQLECNDEPQDSGSVGGDVLAPFVGEEAGDEFVADSSELSIYGGWKEGWMQDIL